MFHPVTYNERKIRLQLTNLAVGNHDLVCECKEPAFHQLKILTRELAPQLTKQQKKEIKQCLGMEEEDGTAPGEEEDFDFAHDLEKLFEIEDTKDDEG